MYSQQKYKRCPQNLKKNYDAIKLSKLYKTNPKNEAKILREKTFTLAFRGARTKWGL